SASTGLTTSSSTRTSKSSALTTNRWLAAVRLRATTIRSRARTRSFCGFGPGLGDPNVIARNPAWQEAPTMEPATERPRHEAIDQDDDLLVHEWRVTQLTRLGIPWSLAQAAADHADWHQVAKLVRRGCPPRLALPIARGRSPLGA